MTEPTSSATASPPSPLSVPDPWNLVAEAYTSITVPLFEAFAREALTIAGVREGTRVVDVACGPGTLSVLAARAGAEVAALDFSPAMIAQLRGRIAREGLRAIDAREGDGMALPYADGAFDAGFSMFGLMFFPDRARGFSELHRVLAKGTTAVVSSWVDLSQVPTYAAVFGTFAEIAARPGSPPPPRPMPLVDPEDGRAEMRAGGFEDVEVRRFAATVAYDSLRAMLDDMVRTNAPIALQRRALGEARFAEVEAEWRARLAETLGEGPQRFEMPANLIVGRRA